MGTDKNTGKVTTVIDTAVDYFIDSSLFLMYVEDCYVNDFDPMFSDIHNKIDLVIDQYRWVISWVIYLIIQSMIIKEDNIV